MTDKDKELLLKDLCARLPYGVKAEITFGKIKEIKTFESKYLFSPPYTSRKPKEYEVKLFLRPMSSMTKKEQKELEKIIDGILGYKARNYFHSEDDYKWNTLYEAIDWLNAHHFDYRGLIPMGLALEAPEGMYKIK